MKRFFTIKLSSLCLTAMICSALSLQAQSTKNVTLADFSALTVSAGIEVYLTQGNTESAKIVADQELINEVEIKKNGSKVSVGWKDDWTYKKMGKNKTAKVYISYKKINGLSASSGASIRTENTLRTDKLDASVSSGASINAEINCKELELNTSSGSSVLFKGNAETLSLESSSGSNVDALGLNTEYAKVSASSGASTNVSVSKALETHSSSGGNIRYKGNAALKNESNSRNAGVSRIN